MRVQIEMARRHGGSNSLGDDNLFTAQRHVDEFDPMKVCLIQINWLDNKAPWKKIATASPSKERKDKKREKA